MLRHPQSLPSYLTAAIIMPSLYRVISGREEKNASTFSVLRNGWVLFSSSFSFGRSLNKTGVDSGTDTAAIIFIVIGFISGGNRQQ